MRNAKALAVAAGGFLAAVLFNSGTPLAQHSYTPQQVQQGKALYDANCGRCHNDDGAGVTGIELFKQIRRASSDDDVAKLIINGITGTSMPPHTFTTEQALNVVAYMRSMVGVTVGSPAAAAASDLDGFPAGLTGDPARGKVVFTGKGGCAACHRAEGAGGTTGPDLSAAPPGGGRGRGGPPPRPDPNVLARSILDPDADIAVPYRRFQVTPRTGAPVRGTLLNQDTFSVQLRDEAQNLRSFHKADLKEFGFMPSAMPSYRGRLTPQEVADVVSYLISTRGPAL